jgi:hypothetical protein
MWGGGGAATPSAIVTGATISRRALSIPGVAVRHRGNSNRKGLTMSQTSQNSPTGQDSAARTYAVLLPGDESRWDSATDEQRAATYARHEQFAKLLEDRGHEVTGGAELTHSRETRQVRGDLDAVTVTDGPFAETTEQLTGFYLVRTSDLDDLLKVCGVIAEHDTHGAPVEVRPLVAREGEGATS